MDTFNEYIHLSRHARFDYGRMRRELFTESVNRYVNAISQRAGSAFDVADYTDIYTSICNLEVMPSMRMLKTAGPALDRDNASGYNCSALPVDSIESIAESMYLLLCGVGVGCSVERRFIAQVPAVPSIIIQEDRTLVVPDNRNGWCSAFYQLMQALLAGRYPHIDYSQIRPAGAILRTFGGRASGPDALKEIFEFTIKLFKTAQGRKLTSVECFDLMCKVGAVVVNGGVRRAAIIAISDLDDTEMANVKSGEWYNTHPHRRFANVSAVYNTHPSQETFDQEWDQMIDSKSGERGIFNRSAVDNKVAALGLRSPNENFLVNPCGEIFLRPWQLCNLSEVIARPWDDLKSIMRKIRLATIMGSVQATYTDFGAGFLHNAWQKNGEEERLLGVSLTGIFDCPYLMNASPAELEYLRNYSHIINADYANRLGINAAPAVTTIKPSGTVSLVANCAPGIHPSHSEFYVRAMREFRGDPLTQFLIDSGVQHEPEVGKEDTGVILYFARKSHGKMSRKNLLALDHLRLYDRFNRYWCDHNPSITVSVREHEWAGVRKHVYQNLPNINGVTFIPYFESDTIYQQAPYQECTEAEYNALLAKTPEIDWSKLIEYEREDYTKGAQELSCFGGVCGI